MDFYEEVKDCLWFNPNRKNYRCESGILDSFETGQRYNCVKNGRCFSYKSEEQHNLEVAQRKEQWEKETYERLKKKFEGSSK